MSAPKVGSPETSQPSPSSLIFSLMRASLTKMASALTAHNQLQHHFSSRESNPTAEPTSSNHHEDRPQQHNITRSIVVAQQSSYVISQGGIVKKGHQEASLLQVGRTTLCHGCFVAVDKQHQQQHRHPHERLAQQQWSTHNQ